jgi:hypothetical protein
MYTMISLKTKNSMQELFQICVDILRWIAGVTGITYEEANIWIFVIIHPLLTLGLLIRNSILKKRLQTRNVKTA